ncbi:MAG: DNA repair protein RadC [Lachnospiraceae bacterium]|nr:DNA repair protein RadC [Lachnospiraceae bacterium]
MNRNTTIKKLPLSERPYEKCKKYGPISLSDAELLAVIIRSGTRGRKAIDLANDILCGHEENLLNLERLSMKEMALIDGIGEVKAIQLKCLTEISKRLSGYRYNKDISLNSPEEIASYFMEDMRHLDREVLKTVLFDTKFNIISEKTITVGTVNASLVSPREIFIEALRDNAVAMVLLHNHPSGDPAPSTEDKEITERVRLGGKLLEITLADHIIIGDKSYFSFKEEGLL